MANEDVNIVIGAQDKASSVLDNVAAKAGSFSTSFAAMGPVVAGVGAAVSAAAAVFNVASSAIDGVVESANRIDALTDVASGLGTSVGDIQAFQFALGELGNVDPEKAVASLQRLQKTVGEVATGGDSDAGSVFEKLGIDAEKLTLQGPIEQFRSIQTALGGVESVAERAALAQQLLGKSAADLIPALTATQEEYGLSVEAAKQLGVVVSDEGAAGIAAMNDAIGRAEKGMEGLYNQVAVAVAPAVEAIADTIVEWVPPVITIAEQVLPFMVDGFTQVAGYATDIAGVLGKIQAYDFASAANLATNMETADKWLAQVNQRREEAEAKAAANAQQRKAEQEAAAVLAQAALDKASEAAGKPAADLMKTLERQLQVAREGEEAVRRQEQLALARNDAERERITLLQDQIAEQERQNELLKQADAEAKKQQDEELKRFQEIAKKMAMPVGEVKATESRLLSRGPSDGPLQGILEENKEQKRLAQEQLKVSEEANRLLRERQNTLQLEFVG